jgi:hypothetical protein
MADKDKSKDELLDEAINLYTHGHLQDAVLKLESLVERYPDDVELRDTLNTVKAEVHDQNREKAAAKPAVSITTADEIKQNARKRARLAIVILIFLIILITGLWGLARVLSSYQNRGTGTYRLAEDKANGGEKEMNEEGVIPSPAEAPAKGSETAPPGTTPAPGTEPGAVAPGSPAVPPAAPTETPSTTPATTPTSPAITPVIPTPTAEPETPQPVGDGYLKISPSPPTTVYVDNVMIGNSQRLGAIKLSEGTHSVTMVSQQYGNRSFSVSIKAGKTTISSFPF